MVLTLNKFDQLLAVAQLPASTRLSAELYAELMAADCSSPGESMVSVTRTGPELSFVVPESLTSRISEEATKLGVSANDIKIEAGWRAFKVAGQLDFGLTGILASLAAPLATAGIPLFVVSTYDTDVILVKDTNADKAVAAWQAANVAQVA